MPRNNRTSSRPTFSKPSNSAPQRHHSTAATAPAPVQTSQSQPPQVVQVQSGGVLSNILQTAAGVAVGHTVGRMVSGLFEGGNNAVDNTANNTKESEAICQADTKRFLDCMQKNYDDVSACQTYLDMLKQCQRQFAQ